MRVLVSDLWSVPRLSSSQIELCKWVGLLAMVCDHVDRAFFGDALIGWTEFGRLTFPAFAFALAQGLSQLEVERVGKVVVRLVVAGAVAQLFFFWLWGRGDLNCLFTFALGAGLWWVWVSWRVALIVAVPLALWASTAVEFQWPGLVMVVATIWACRGWGGLPAWFFGLAVLGLVNRNSWGYLVVPLVFVLQLTPLAVPRVRGLFYWLYPGHMAVLCLVRAFLGVL